MMLLKKRLDEIDKWTYDAWLLLVNIRKVRQNRLQKSIHLKEGDDCFSTIYFDVNNNLKELLK